MPLSRVSGIPLALVGGGIVSYVAVADVSINQAYDNFGYTYQLFWEEFHRDSIDGQGLAIEGLVHFGTSYDNAFWDGEGHMFFGDGDGQMLTDTTRGIDVVRGVPVDAGPVSGWICATLWARFA